MFSSLVKHARKQNLSISHGRLINTFREFLRLENDVNNTGPTTFYEHHTKSFMIVIMLHAV